jgi:hypothetical protein
MGRRGRGQFLYWTKVEKGSERLEDARVEGGRPTVFDQ